MGHYVAEWLSGRKTPGLEKDRVESLSKKPGDFDKVG